MTWKDSFETGKELVLCTCSADKPHANIAVSLGFVDNKLVIADCQMAVTIKNLQNNKDICIIGSYLRLKGTAEILSSGRYFDFCVKHAKDYTVKNAMVISVKDVFDLDNGKKVF